MKQSERRHFRKSDCDCRECTARSPAWAWIVLAVGGALIAMMVVMVKYVH